MTVPPESGVAAWKSRSCLDSRIREDTSSILEVLLVNDFSQKMESDLRDRLLSENTLLSRPGDCRLDAKVSVMKMKANAKTYVIGNLTLKQPEVMEWIIQQMVDPERPRSLKQIAAIKGAPDLRSIYAWRRAFPSFDEEMKNAEAIRAMLLAEESVEVAMNEDDYKKAGLAKTKAESLRWMASKLDPFKFADRKMEQANDQFKDASISQLMDAVRESIKSNADIIKTLSQHERQQFIDMGVMDAEVVKEEE